MKYTDQQVAAAIDAEAAGWALFFGVAGDDTLEGRKLVMRANVSVGYLEPLIPYLLQMPKRCGACGMQVGSQQACCAPWVYDAELDRCVNR